MILHWLRSLRRSPRDPGIRSEAPDFDADRAAQLLKLTGKACVEYFSTRYGLNPRDWRPKGQDRHYARYLPPELPPELEQLCTINLHNRDLKQRQPIGLLARHSKKNEVYLVFRGSIQDEEWVQDILLMQTPCEIKLVGSGSGRVHLGFQRMFQSLQPGPKEWRRYLGAPGKRLKLFTAGHSLGGALAVLSALELHEYQPHCYTFGAPRVGDAYFAAAVDRFVPHTFRLENFRDPIPTLPREKVDLIFRKYEYRHAGRTVPIYSLSHAGGESIPRLIRAGKNLKSYIYDKLFKEKDAHIDLLFAHQLPAYEHGIAKLTGDRPD